MTAAVETITITVNGAKYTSGTVSSSAATVAVPYSLRGATITGYEAVVKDGTTVVPATASVSTSTDIPVSSTTATVTVKNAETQATIDTVTLTVSTIPVLVSEQYYRKTFLGNGNKTALIAEPALGFFYIDASNGEVYVYDGATWNKVSGATVTVTV